MSGVEKEARRPMGRSGALEEVERRRRISERRGYGMLVVDGRTMADDAADDAEGGVRGRGGRR